MSNRARANICKKALKRNLDQFAEAYKSPSFVIPSVIATQVHQLANNVSELVQNYSSMCYFGIYPDLFYSTLSDEVI